MYTGIIKLLESRGYQAYISDETARDIYLGKTPKRHHVAVAAQFTELQQQFKEFIVVSDSYTTTLKFRYRNDLFIVRPLQQIKLDHMYCSYKYTDSFEVDAKYRGYTIQALYYNPIKKTWLNFYGAKLDIDNKIIRLINGQTSLLEAKIRLLSGPTLAGSLGEGWKLASKTHDAIKASHLKVIMAHTSQIRVELTKVFGECRVPSKVFNILRSTKLLDVLFPELVLCIGIPQSNKRANLDLYQHIMYALDSVKLNQTNSVVIRVAALLHDIAKPHTQIETETGMHFYSHEIVGAMLAERILFRWGFSKPLSKKVSLLVRNHLFDAYAKVPIKSIKRLIARVGPENIHDLIDLRIADRYGTGRKDISMKKVHAFRARINKELAKISPTQFKLVLSETDIHNYIQYSTDNATNAIEPIQQYLENKVLYGRLANKTTNLKRAIREINKIKCPLDKAHLFKTWTKIGKADPEIFEDGKLRCGVYCNFICDKLKQKTNS